MAGKVAPKPDRTPIDPEHLRMSIGPVADLDVVYPGVEALALAYEKWVAEARGGKIRVVDEFMIAHNFHALILNTLGHDVSHREKIRFYKDAIQTLTQRMKMEERNPKK